MTLRRKDLQVWLWCLLIAAACLLLCSKSSPFYPLNDWEDANAYFSAGKGILGGMVMYRDLYEHKGPLLYMLHALCALVSHSSFLGVFLMEILAVSLFLMAIYKTIALYGAKQSAWMLLPAATMLILSSTSFYYGDSAEELSLPLLAWPLYFLLRWLKQEAPHRMKARTLILSGALCGSVLWIKFTMLGFFVPWIGGLMLYHLLKGKPRSALSAFGWFSAGIGLATLPWFLYFLFHGALGDWFQVYLYDNVFLYATTETLTLADRLKDMLKTAWDWFIRNPGYTVPLAAGVIWFTVSKKHSATEKIWLWSLLLFLGVGVFIGGKPYVYYGFILAAFAAVFVLPVCKPLDRALAKRPVLDAAFVSTLSLLSVLLCFIISPNTGDLLKPREDTMQYRFAAQIQKTENPTLLNYFFMDTGFYTAADVAPSVKYFHYTNVPLDEMLAEQTRYIEDGVTDYVITRGRQPESITDLYTLIATEKATEGLWYDFVYLYERNDLLVSD